MCQTFFNIPANLPGWLGGWPVFGFGALFAAWLLAGLGVAIWLARRDGWTWDTFTQLALYALCGAALAFLPPWFDLLHDGSLPIRGYGVLLLLAVASAVALSVRRARQAGQDPEMIFSLATWLFVSGIGGARVFYVIENWQDYQRPTVGETIKSVLNVAQGGLVVYGSLLAGGLALVIFVRKYRLPGLALADLIVPGVVLGMAIGRLGCFMNGCCYGGESDLAWSVAFPWGSPPFVEQVRAGRLPIHGLRFAGPPEEPATLAGVEPGSAAEAQGLRAGDVIAGINGVRTPSTDAAIAALARVDRSGESINVRAAGAPRRSFAWQADGFSERSLHVHPAQLYSAIDLLILLMFLLAYDPFRRRDGELLALLMTIHPITRFLLEWTRAEPHVWGTRLSIAQVISVALLVGGAALWAAILNRPPRRAWGAA